MYFARMEAINFTQAHDDGAATRDLDKAQVILVGVSRCGKTPTSLYLALQFGIRAANFPLTPDDFADRKLPASVLPFRDRLFGLTIHPERLRKIREERRPGQQLCAARQLPARSARSRAPDAAEGIPMLDTTVEVDRGNRDDDPASRQARTAHFLEAWDDSGTLLPVARVALPHGLEQHHGGGRRRIQRFAARRHRNRDALINAREQFSGEPAAFAADRNRDTPAQVRRVQRRSVRNDRRDDPPARRAKGGDPCGRFRVFD